VQWTKADGRRHCGKWGKRYSARLGCPAATVAMDNLWGAPEPGPVHSLGAFLWALLFVFFSFPGIENKLNAN